MDEKRIKHFSNGDLSVGFFLERFALIVDAIDPKTPLLISDINDALEYVNIIKFIENKLFDRRWTNEYIKDIESKKAIIYKALNVYFRNLKSTNVFMNLSKIKYDYVDDLLAQVEKYKLADTVKPADFEKALLKSNARLSSVLKSEYLVRHYNDILKKIFLSNPSNFEIILSLFSDSSGTNTYIPTISKDEMLVIANQYIDSAETNINFLRVMGHKVKGLERYVIIDAATRLKAIKRADILEKELFDNQPGSGVSVKMAVLSTKEAYEKELEGSAPTDYIDFVDAKWIEKHHDFPTLLNNIQYLYSFFTYDLISSLPSFPSIEMSTLETHMGVRTTHHYPDGQVFSVKQRMATMRLKALSSLLKQYSITIEDIIDWFFSDYCKNEFNIDWLPLNFSSETEKTANRTATIFRIEESIRTQYAVLLENGEIDRELVNLMSTPKVNELQSRIDKRYAYPDNQSDAQNIMDLLYSDQSRIAYISKKLKGENFIHLILHNDVKMSDFHDYQKPIVKHLLDNNFIIEADNATLHIRDVYTPAALQRLHHHGVTGYHHVNQDEQKVLDRLFDEKRIRFGKTFFSEQESDYLNYLLNDSVFDNSAGIRNKYQHGTPSYEHDGYYESDYLYAQLVLLLYVIKLNDEFSVLKVLDGKDPSYCIIDE